MHPPERRLGSHKMILQVGDRGVAFDEQALSLDDPGLAIVAVSYSDELAGNFRAIAAY